MAAKGKGKASAPAEEVDDRDAQFLAAEEQATAEEVAAEVARTAPLEADLDAEDSDDDRVEVEVFGVVLRARPVTSRYLMRGQLIQQRYRQAAKMGDQAAQAKWDSAYFEHGSAALDYVLASSLVDGQPAVDDDDALDQLVALTDATDGSPLSPYDLALRLSGEAAGRPPG